MDQNLCAQGELPRFVRNFYDDCRGPPRLFLLDKYDAHLEFKLDCLSAFNFLNLKCKDTFSDKI
jgi:hypothetical protein